MTDEAQSLIDKLQSMQRVVLERELDVQRQLDDLSARLAKLEGTCTEGS
jgi:hypothetical protein